MPETTATEKIDIVRRNEIREIGDSLDLAIRKVEIIQSVAREIREVSDSLTDAVNLGLKSGCEGQRKFALLIEPAVRRLTAILDMETR